MKEVLRNKFNKYRVDIFGNLFFIIFSSILLILNFNFMYVLHQSSGMLKIVFYEFYKNAQLLPFYIIITVSLVNIISLLFINKQKIRVALLSIQPLISIFSIIIMFINPQFLIPFLQGVSSTKLEYLELGGYLYILLSLFFMSFIIFEIQREEFLKSYLKYLSIIIAVFFFSSFVHENGHAFFILITGGRITGYAPLPVLDFKNFAGYVCYQGVPTEFLPLVMMGGEIFQWISILVIGSLLKFKKFNKSVELFLSLAIIISWLDFPLYSINNTFGLPHWFIFGSSSGDIVNVSTMLGIDMLYFNLLAITQLSIGAIIIYFKIIRKRINLEMSIFHKKIQEVKTKA